MINSYLSDERLAALVTAEPAFWRLDVDTAVAVIERDLESAWGRDPGWRTAALDDSFRAWQRQASALPKLPHRPIHPDAHWHNYLVVDGEPLLLDWDHIDLSDPFRDVGPQLWGFLPRRHWREALVRLGLPDDSAEAVCWWAGFKMLGNALFNHDRGDSTGAAAHLDMFRIAAAGKAWLPRP